MERFTDMLLYEQLYQFAIKGDIISANLLLDKYSITFDNSKKQLIRVLELICFWEQYSFGTWFYSQFEFERNDIHDILNAACNELDLNTLDWLIKTFNVNRSEFLEITEKRYEETGNDFYTESANLGKIDILKWCQDTLKFDKDFMNTNYNVYSILHNITDTSIQHTVKMFFIRNYQFTKEDLYKSYINNLKECVGVTITQQELEKRGDDFHKWFDSYYLRFMPQVNKNKRARK